MRIFVFNMEIRMYGVWYLIIRAGAGCCTSVVWSYLYERATQQEHFASKCHVWLAGVTL